MKTVYSPQLDRELVHQLYLKAKAQQVPMTVLTRDLLREALELPRPGEPPRVRRRQRRPRKAHPSARQVDAVLEEAIKASHLLDELTNAFALLLQACCGLRENKPLGRKKVLSLP